MRRKLAPLGGGRACSASRASVTLAATFSEEDPTESTGMSELGERRWAVLSERGGEAAGLTYEEAAALVAELRGRDVSGLCVITDEAARHVPQVRKGNKGAHAAPRSPKRARRGAGKSSA